MKKHSHDIVIVGGGMVGMTMAIALAQQTSLSVALLETNPVLPSWQADQYYPRVSAFALSSIRIFKAVGAWQSIRDKRVSPFTHIHVWDDKSSGQIDFDTSEIAEPVLGYIIENAAVQASLTERLQQFPQISVIHPVQLQSLKHGSDSLELLAQDGQIFNARLAIAADGAQSWLREQVGIGLKIVPYDQKGIVTTVKTALPHQKTARQVFLETGPLAFLPLEDAHTSSIVWTLPADMVDAKLALTDDEFRQELAEAFSYHLGEVTHIEKRFAFPLQKQQASSYISERVVLAGDAAHTVHPLAGQGVNMGLLDAASLVEVIVDAHMKRKDWSGRHVLRRYERWRKADNANLLTGVDMIKNLFASDKRAVQGLRASGLTMLSALPLIRNMFTCHAVGNRGNLPVMAHPHPNPLPQRIRKNLT